MIIKRYANRGSLEQIILCQVNYFYKPLERGDNIKPIKDFDGYFVDKKGRVFSNKSGELKQMKTFFGSAKKYEQLKLCKNGKSKHKLVHRLVAETYIPNPNNYPEVDHIDNNTFNNNLENLRWCTRKFNLKRSYETMSPVRNFTEADLYYNNKFIKKCQSISEASRYASKHFGASPSGLIRNYKSRGCKIIKRSND